MKEKIRYIIGKRSFHIGMVIVIIAIILFILGMIVLKYNVEGETNMPFQLKKIILISSSEGVDKEAGENKWAFDINQNNDIYLYIEKNQNYEKQEAIKTITVDHINVQKQNETGNIKFYRPNISEQEKMFTNKEENLIQSIEYEGAMESDIKNLKISNQGGKVVFRYANDKIAEYVSNDEEINHSELLKKSNITEENLRAKLTFDFMIETEAGKEYKANISLNMPVDGVIENGTASDEITDMSNIIFKRTKN
jgi:hypothetical protein